MCGAYSWLESADCWVRTHAGNKQPQGGVDAEMVQKVNKGRRSGKASPRSFLYNKELFPPGFEVPAELFVALSHCGKRHQEAYEKLETTSLKSEATDNIGLFEDFELDNGFKGLGDQLAEIDQELDGYVVGKESSAGSSQKRSRDDLLGVNPIPCNLKLEILMKKARLGDSLGGDLWYI